MRVCLLQSNYIPWKGYFDLIAASDLCVLYDSRQYTKNDWRNRNRLIVGGQPAWLSIPVRTGGRLGQRICDVEVAHGLWAKKHWRTIEQSYVRRPEFARYAERWKEEWRLLEDVKLLSAVNERLIRLLMKDLGIRTDVQRDQDIPALQALLENVELHPSATVARICETIGASEYLTGPAGRGYLRSSDFAERGITLVVASYQGYRPYPQGSGQFTHEVSVIDLIANLGTGARDELIGASWEASGTAAP